MVPCGMLGAPPGKGLVRLWGCASIYGRAGPKAVHAGAPQCRAAHSSGEHARFSRNELRETPPEHRHVHSATAARERRLPRCNLGSGRAEYYALLRKGHARPVQHRNATPGEGRNA